jgi:hypothetical protein
VPKLDAAENLGVHHRRDIATAIAAAGKREDQHQGNA